MSSQVLFVCTGNICRSPMAERMLRSIAPEVTITSAGTRALTGYGIDGTAAFVLREMGVDPDRHVARQLTPDDVQGAELVLTASLAHRNEIVRADPAAMRRTFTLREFTRLGASLDPPPTGPFDQRVAAVAGQRGLINPAEPGADDVPDPFTAPLPVMQECARQLHWAVTRAAVVLGLDR